MERLELRSLGPIEHLLVEPRELMVLVGEQASGKSLVSQCLYLFRNLRTALSDRYRPDIRNDSAWKKNIMRLIADDLRGSSFGYFANGTATLKHSSESDADDQILRVYENNRWVHPGRNLGRRMERWVDDWESDPASLALEDRPQIYLPTERSLFTRLVNSHPKVLFEDFQPSTVRDFASKLQGAIKEYAGAQETYKPLRLLQRKALKGEAYIPKRGPKTWKWKTGNGGKKKVLPIEIVASGQMEAWPFFVVAESCMRREILADYYFEEPETHLHPHAQVQILDAIVHLVNAGNRFVVTTHSPFLLQHLNNLLLMHQQTEGKAGIDPEKLSAYRLSAGSKDLVDRKDTGLIDAMELERVADDLGRQFDELLDAIEGDG